jgi:hypothetical protein
VHPADTSNVSGRMEPLYASGLAAHAVRIRAAVITSDSPIVQTMRPVLEFWCENPQCDWAPALDDPGGYSWPDIRDKIMRAHEGSTP